MENPGSDQFQRSTSQLAAARWIAQPKKRKGIPLFA
jgi:hypothetical protein